MLIYREKNENDVVKILDKNNLFRTFHFEKIDTPEHLARAEAARPLGSVEILIFSNPFFPVAVVMSAPD